MAQILRVAIAQIDTVVGDFRTNREKIALHVEEAKRNYADVVLFPELAVPGYPPEDLLLKEHFLADNMAAVNYIAPWCRNITCVAGFAYMGNGKEVYNAAAVMHGGAVKGIYCKNVLPNYGVFDEKRYFKPASTNSVFVLGDLAFGVNICEDIWVKDGPYLAQAAAGAGVLFNISASPYHKGKTGERLKLMAKRAKETGAYIFYANLVGGQDELVFDGGSFVLSPKGKLIAFAKEFKEDIIYVDIDIKRAASRKSHAATVKGVQKIYLTHGNKTHEKPALKKRRYEKLDELEEIYEALVLGARDYAAKNGFEKAVLGLSGGVDSALTAAIACSALGKENVTGLIMPSEYSSGETMHDAERVARNLGMKYLVIPINDILTMYLGEIEKAFNESAVGVTEENLQARIRGNIIMAFSNKYGFLVLTTGNKSEVAVGYCTLYGDMAGGLAVIKDVPKLLVYKLSGFANKNAGKNVIPLSVMKRPPTAELRPNQKDQDSLPPYDVLDRILKLYIEEDRSFDDIVSARFDPALVRKVINMVDTSEYKRRQGPPGIKITPKAFGRDRRLPITNRYRENMARFLGKRVKGAGK